MKTFCMYAYPVSCSQNIFVKPIICFMFICSVLGIILGGITSAGYLGLDASRSVLSVRPFGNFRHYEVCEEIMRLKEQLEAWNE